MNYVNDNNKEAKIYGKDNESCERLEQDDISVWSNWGRVLQILFLSAESKFMKLGQDEEGIN